MSDTIKIKKIKGIEELSYTLPNKSGVYLLTGENGTGKTTLLTVLNRLGDNLTFAKEFGNIQTLPAQHSVEFNINGKTVTYQKRKMNWTPSPQDNSELIKQYKYHQTYYLSATGLRLYRQSIIDLSKEQHHEAHGIGEAMNEIFGTSKFSDLQYIKVKEKRGRQKQLNRDNKLYVLQNSSGVRYSELDFSLGERMVLNALDYISSIQSFSMLLIDEIELALHPIAQVRFYNYLLGKSNEKDLVIIISTHSATLIKQARNLQYLENNKGRITMVDSISPAYVLKGLSVDTDNRPDYLFFVEDIMAKLYLTKVIDKLKENINELKEVCIQIVPVGGYEQVLNLMNYFYGVNPFSDKNVHSFLDGDVEDVLNELKAKTERTPADERKIALFNANRKNHSFLSITPELGFWNEIINNKDWFDDAFRGRYSGTLFNLKAFIDEAEAEEKARNCRTRAKNCLKNLHDRISKHKPDLDKGEFDRFVVDAYVERKVKNKDFVNDAKNKIMPVLRRK